MHKGIPRMMMEHKFYVPERRERMPGYNRTEGESMTLLWVGNQDTPWRRHPQ
jgi:hypothetical protein